MSAYLLSQILIAIAILFDLASFQFKDRRKILCCLCVAGVLISIHFFLLQQYTAFLLMALAVMRYCSSIFTTSKFAMITFIGCSIIATAYTYMGVISIISLVASSLQTVAAFCHEDKKLRQLMIVGTSIWLLHNYLVGSPTAVIMEILFLSSNLLGYYRFYIKGGLQVT